MNEKENGNIDKQDSSLRKDKKNNSKKKAKSKKSIGKKIVIFFGILILIAVISVGGLGGYIYYTNKDSIHSYIEKGYEKVADIQSDTFNSRYSTEIYDTNGNLIKEFKFTDYVYKTYDEINPNVFNALIAIEDHRFYEHNGIDYLGLARAGVKIITSKGEVVQGGSTITQQLVKNVFLTMDRTVWRKLEEMVIAQELEKLYSKEEILEFYVNNINYGNGAYSIESASQYYFQKDTNSLTIPEIALLTGIPNNPSLYDPIRNPENALDKRNIILERMFEVGYITEEDKNKYQAEEIKLNVKDLDIDNTINGYDLNFAMDKAVEEIMKLQGFQFRYSFDSEENRDTYYEKYSTKYDEAREELISGGYKIETSINPELQNKLQEITDNRMSPYTEMNSNNGLYMKQSASTVIDNSTGEVVAIVGGRSESGNTFNRASLGYRQPGSAIKPFVSYTPSFENGLSPEDILEDKAIPNGPVNYYYGYKGKVTVKYAVEDSINTTAYNLILKVGADKALDYLKDMKFKYLMPQDNNPIISVGGFTKGVTTTELSSAYSTLSRNGEFISPTNIKKITKRSNESVVYENIHKKSKIYDVGASYLMTETLKGVVNKPHGTGYGARIDNFTNQAGKSGSTDDYKDAWMAGYTKHYSMATWVGDDIPKAQYGNASGNVSKWIYKDMMNYLHSNKEDIEFEKPENVYTDNNGAMRVKFTPKNNEQQKRTDKEESRRLDEIKAQQERIGEEEYRIKYGLSEEEEQLREVRAEGLINNLANYKLTTTSQEPELRGLISEARNAVDSVKRKSAYDSLNQKLTNAISDLNAKLDSLYKAERDEEERIAEEKRKEEELKAEEERKKQEEEEKRKEEEEANKPKPPTNEDNNNNNGNSNNDNNDNDLNKPNN